MTIINMYDMTIINKYVKYERKYYRGNVTCRWKNWRDSASSPQMS